MFYFFYIVYDFITLRLHDERIMSYVILRERMRLVIINMYFRFQMIYELFLFSVLELIMLRGNVMFLPNSGFDMYEICHLVSFACISLSYIQFRILFIIITF